MDDENASCGVDGVIITGDLDGRPSRAPDYEGESRALAVLGEALSTSPDTVLQRLVEVAMELTRSDSAGISLLEPGGEQGTFRWAATAGVWAPYRNGTMPREDSPCGDVMAREAVLLVSQPERVWPALLRADPGISEGLLAPFHINGVPVGTIWTIKHSPDGHFEAEDARLLKSLAQYASVAHQTTLALSAARAGSEESEARYRTLFDSMDQGFCIIEKVEVAPGQPSDFRYLTANPAFERHTGLRNVIGKTIRELVPGAEQSVMDVYADVVRTGEHRRLESCVADLNLWMEAEAFPAEEPGQVAVLFSNVSQRKQAETGLRESQERQSFLLKLSDALRLLADPEEIQSTATRLLGERLHVTRVFYFTVEPDGDNFLLRRDYVNGVPSVAGWFTISQFDAHLAESWRGGRTVHSPDVHARDANSGRPYSLEQLAAFDATQARAWLGVPLVKAGRLVAVMGISHAEPRAWTESEITLAENVAERTWAAVERARAETALRESEMRLQQFGEASQDVLWMRDAETFQWEYLTPAFETIYGLDREAALRGDNMATWLELIVPEDREHASASLSRVRNGEWVTFEYRVRRPVDGQIRWMRDTDFPIQDASRKVVRIGGIGHDITELKRIEEALAAAEARQRILMEGIPQLVWRSCDKGLWTWASPQWLNFTGQSQGDTHGRGWLDAVHPDDRATTMRAWEEALPHGMLDTEYRVRRAADGAWVWHHTRSVPVRDPEGRIVEWLGTSTDIQNLRELQDQQHVLVAELQHRTRNLMGVVRSMSDKTARTSADLPDFRARFRDRLEALSRVQGLLSRLNEHDRVNFDELIEAELAALDGAADRVSVHGPRGVRLRSSMVQTLAMALHELATNAIKYGALGQPRGRLAITWSLEADGPGERPWLHIDWRESGVTMPPVGSKPTGGGQGRELIERALPYQLSAKTTYELGPDGVHCTISIPVSTRTLAREAEHA